jgi:hypothetical protein
MQAGWRNRWPWLELRWSTMGRLKVQSIQFPRLVRHRPEFDGVPSGKLGRGAQSLSDVSLAGDDELGRCQFL